MDEMPNGNELHQKFARLSGYLDSDPDNLNLIGDVCSAAFDAGLMEETSVLLSRYESLAPLPLPMVNMKGLVALRQNRFEDAAALFEGLLAEKPDDPGLRFNLAWSVTMMGEHQRAADLLDDATVAAVAGAGALKVQALHRLGDLEAALQYGVNLMARRPHDSRLMGALSLVAIDSQMPELARECASKSQDTPEGVSALGVLLLAGNELDEAELMFERGLEMRPDSARNMLGKGLVRMASGDAIGAAGYLDQSAELFQRHLGTWIAAGWAHFAAGDRQGARRVFEHALGLDDTFAETHGALAVLDILDDQIESARRRTDTALRLDRQCFAGALAKSLLLERDGDPQAAQRVRDITLNRPLQTGQTLAQAIVALATSRPKGSAN